MKLTNKEAETLIAMIKKRAEEQILKFPASKGEKISFDVLGERRNDAFIVSIDRKGINAEGCSYQGRIKSNNTILLRLDINPSGIHKDIDGEIIVGSHLHIYDEEVGFKKAIPFDVNNKDLFELCYLFFKKFNIIEPTNLKYQQNIFDEV